MSNNRKERNLGDTAWTNLQNSFMDSATIGNSSLPSQEGQRGVYETSNLQQHNENLYNIAKTGSNAASNVIYQQQQQHQQQQQQQQPERYSVLPVGHGNFLKVYHNEQQSFNNYELFSSNSFINANPINKSSTPSITNVSYDIKKNFDNNDNRTNMIINQLVTNWSPNLSGTYSPFGEQQQQQQQQQLASNHHFIASNPQGIITSNINDAITNQMPSSSNNGNHHHQPMNSSLLSSSSKNQFNSSIKTNGNFENSNNNHNNMITGSGQSVEVKKRIVAEVKPMRMSYSDVLSKNVTINNNKGSNNNTTSNNGNSTAINSSSSSSSSSSNSDSTNNIQSRNKMKTGGNFSSNATMIVNDKKLNSQVFEDNSNKQQQQQQNQRKFVENTQHTYKNDENSSTQQNSLSKDKKKLNGTENSVRDDSTQSQWKNNKKSLNVTASTMKSSSKQRNSQMNNAENNSNNNIGGSNKKKSSKRDNDQDDYRTNMKTNNNDKDGLYNVTKNDYNNSYNYGSEKKTSVQYSINQPKSSKTKLSSSSNLNIKNTTNCNTIGNTRFERQIKRNQKHQRNGDMMYDLIAKFFEKWLEYTIKIISWLFYLIYDIIVLGFSMLYERIHQFYDISYSYFQNLRNEFKNNSTFKLWIKNLFKKFDTKFKKNSKFAFWRKFYNYNSNKKKQTQSGGGNENESSTTDFYKNGRLPQTGDEAMYSLLNCKGKDAYSILGVTADSSQEQIRKHYKKIAVLVHPDKNKQPGAEEAFKVLQRAFELIGEPENRKKYDQSLAEALNAEKAWTELHDLLSQLQSKIAEAANTIRCSSCGLRHPRKLTERPHYAARECSSCKIRHSAREGDIWAETSIFGLRWKYLALMEGKVYDITEWANCQKGALSQLQPNSHIVQYRIVRGGQQQQQQQQQNQQQSSYQQDKERLKKEVPSEPSLDEFLDNLYSGQNPQNQQQNSSRKRTKRNYN